MALSSLHSIKCGGPKSTIFFFNDPATTEIYTLSLHDALPISHSGALPRLSHGLRLAMKSNEVQQCRSEEHTSELQSRRDIVCRLLLEKKNERKENTLCNCRQSRNITKAGPNDTGTECIVCCCA